MMNEILFGLLGYTGGIFIETPQSFELNQTYDCINHSEREILKNIGKIGYNYKLLKQYVKTNEETFSQIFYRNDDENIFEMSLYFTSICETIMNFLDDYEKIISNLENTYYQNFLLSMSDVLSDTQIYSLIFEKIISLLYIIKSNNSRGGQILNLLYNFSLNGDPSIASVFKLIFINANKQLLSFITSWIINGTIPKYKEFFIIPGNFIITKTNFENNYIDELENWNNQYVLEISNIPVYFPKKLAEDILFVGKTMKILVSNKNLEEDKINFKELSLYYTCLQRLSTLIFKNHDNIDLINIINFELFSEVINLIKNSISKHLWKLVVVKKSFFLHLTSIKNIFLTFHGEFFHNFIINIKHLLSLPIDKKIQQEINEVYFSNALSECYSSDKEGAIYGNFKIKLFSTGFNYQLDLDNLKDYVNNELSLVGNLNFNQSKNVKFIGKSYLTKNEGAIWNLSTHNLDDEFVFKMKYAFDPFIQTDKTNQSSIKINERSFTFNFIFVKNKNFNFEVNPGALHEINNYFNFQFKYIINNDNNLNRISFNLFFINKHKENQDKSKEKTIFRRDFTDNLIGSLSDSFAINFKDNVAHIFTENSKINVKFPFKLDDCFKKEKRSLILGCVMSSINMDVGLELTSWSFNYYAGEVYKENSILFLIDYSPSWPHNFVFHDKIIKEYNSIFNLVFPLKTNLTLLNSLYIDKKNLAKKDKSGFNKINICLSIMIHFLQNLISFYMFDIIEIKFNTFFKKIQQCNDFEELILEHETFIHNVLSISFIKSRRVILKIYNIIFITKKFFNLVSNLIKNIDYDQNIISDSSNKIEELKAEFDGKCKDLINIFLKVKNSEINLLVSQFLSKLDLSLMNIKDKPYINEYND